MYLTPKLYGCSTQNTSRTWKLFLLKTLKLFVFLTQNLGRSWLRCTVSLMKRKDKTTRTVKLSAKRPQHKKRDTKTRLQHWTWLCRKQLVNLPQTRSLSESEKTPRSSKWLWTVISKGPSMNPVSMNLKMLLKDSPKQPFNNSQVSFDYRLTYDDSKTSKTSWACPDSTSPTWDRQKKSYKRNSFKHLHTSFSLKKSSTNPNGPGSIY